MNKRALTLTLCGAMLATVAVSSTLAYFTDTDAENNVFTMGGVQIELIEQQYGENNTLEPFKDEKRLMPGVENKQDKIVSIKNTGEGNAFVWYEWYIPTALDSTDGSTGLNNVLHVNSYGYTWDKYWTDDNYKAPDGSDPVDSVDQTWDHDPEVELKKKVGPQGYFEQVTLADGIMYNKYVVLYHGVLAPNAETTPAMNGVYLDKDLDFDGEVYKCFDKEVNYDFSKKITIPVKAYAIQADLADVDGDGKVNVYDAYLAYNAQVTD